MDGWVGRRAAFWLNGEGTGAESLVATASTLVDTQGYGKYLLIMKEYSTVVCNEFHGSCEWSIHSTERLK